MTLLVDRFMTWFIIIGGLSIILAVFGILIFISAEVLPLFRSASVIEGKSISIPDKEHILLGVDEWGDLPFTLDRKGELQFLDLVKGQPGERKVLDLGGTTIASSEYDPRKQQIAIGTEDGRFLLAKVDYASKLVKDDRGDERREVTGDAKIDLTLPVGVAGKPIIAISYGDAGGDRLAGVIQEVDGKRQVNILPLISKKKGLGKAATVTVGEVYDLTADIKGTPVSIKVDERGESALVVTKEGEVEYFFKKEGKFLLRQRFKPFEEVADPAGQSIATMDFVLGDVSLIFTNHRGLVRKYSIFQTGETEGPEAIPIRKYGKVLDFTAMPGDTNAYDASTRNKVFVVAGDKFAAMLHATSGTVRWQQPLPYQVQSAIFSGKFDKLLLADKENRLHSFAIDDPHPEGGWNAFFGKVWYEGRSEPTYEWQSSGATDDFEPKLSLIPLIFGTLKGTIYAMLISVPIALLAAIYVSEFMHPKFKMIVKPSVEVMASLPSVVLGFLAALWIAPLVEDKVPSVIAVLLTLPIGSMIIGFVWSRLPSKTRILVPPGHEFMAFFPVLLLLLVFSWMVVGPVLENTVFTVKMADGTMVADFRLWWSNWLGNKPGSFEQRNSLVVGVIMGFAVIPIIFTIAEDSLTNVPKALRSGSLALGASRWQTAIRVVLPTASPGIFSALMIGLGRAIGETMIVVMATGNTAVMDWNIFNGMRTLSANIAVELPEAPQASTLYRTLFLGAVLLFLLTFVINTAAELLRQHLREKYKTV